MRPSPWHSAPQLTVDLPAVLPSRFRLGAAGGGMWSKKASVSSYICRNTVLLHTSGSAVSASSTCCVYQPPCTGVDGPGCSQYWRGDTIHDTCGRRPASTSSFKPCSDTPFSVEL